MHWRPYPFDLAHFPTGPAPVAASHYFAGGNQLRDLATLRAAVTALDPLRRPVELLTRHPGPADLPARLLARGTAHLAEFYERLATSRAVLLPITHDPTRAAGLTVAAMALAAGRPVIASATAGTLDHLRHGVDSLLVPPRNPRALARALDRIDQDDALVERLARGAQTAANRLSTRTWAAEILDGPPESTAYPW